MSLLIDSTAIIDTIAVAGDVSLLRASHIKKPIVLVATGNVFIKDSSIVDDVLVFAHGGIFIDTFSEVMGLLISKQQVLISNFSSCKPLTTIIVPKNTEKIYGQPEVGIVNGSNFSGFVCVYDPKTEIAGYSIPATVKKDESSTFFGGIFIDGDAEVYGKIDGFIYARNIQQVVRRTRWINYLSNLQIDRYAIGPNFPIPPIFTTYDQVTLLEWEKINH